MSPQVKEEEKLLRDCRCVKRYPTSTKNLHHLLSDINEDGESDHKHEGVSDHNKARRI